MTSDLMALLSECEHRLGVVRGLLAVDDPDPERVLAGVAAVQAIGLPAAPAEVDEGMRGALERCRALQAEVLGLAQAHRDRLAAALVQLGHAAAGARLYGQTGTAVPRFIDRNQ